MNFFFLAFILTTFSYPLRSPLPESRLSIFFSGLYSGLQSDTESLSSCQSSHQSLTTTTQALLSSLLSLQPPMQTLIAFNDLTNNFVSIIDTCNYPSQLFKLFESSAKFSQILIYNSLKNMKALIESIKRLLIALNSEGDYFNMGLYLGRVIQEALGIWI